MLGTFFFGSVRSSAARSADLYGCFNQARKQPDILHVSTPDRLSLSSDTIEDFLDKWSASDAFLHDILGTC